MAREIVEGSDLLVIEGGRRIVGTGKVAEDQDQFDAVQKRTIGKERLHLIGRQAEPGHAAVDLERGGEGAARCLRQVGPAPDLVQRVEDRGCARVPA